MARSDISWSSLLLVFTGTATTEIYTLSLHDALPILSPKEEAWHTLETACTGEKVTDRANATRVLGLELGSRWHGRSPSLLCIDRKSTRLNSSHMSISYAVFCLKKKKTTTTEHLRIRR